MKRIFSALLALAIALSLAAAVAPVRAAGGKLVAITFDDGPGPYTNRLLDGLAQRGVKATFFMVGSNVARYPDTVARMYRRATNWPITVMTIRTSLACRIAACAAKSARPMTC